MEGGQSTDKVKASILTEKNTNKKTCGVIHVLRNKIRSSKILVSIRFRQNFVVVLV